MALGQSSLAWPGLLLQALPPTGLVVGGKRRRGGRRDKNSLVKAELERKETQQDGKTPEQYSYLHCQRTLTGLKATRLRNHLLNPGACKFLYSTSAQEAAKQAAEVMTAPGVRSMAGDSPGCCRARCRGVCSSAHGCGADGSG